MDYDYQRFEQLVSHLLNSMWRDPDDLEIGRNISDIPEVKIIFDGYGYDEENDVEGGNKDMESYAIFIHKDSGEEGFEFPEHEMTPWCLIHRPKEEVCLYVWYDVKEDNWDILPLEDRLEDCEMTEQDVMNILEILEKRYFNDDLPSNVSSSFTSWPFPSKDD